MKINLKIYFPHKKTNRAERNIKPPTVYELWKRILFKCDDIRI